jgi:hypothetical protein
VLIVDTNSFDVLVFGAGSTFTLNGDGGFENVSIRNLVTAYSAIDFLLIRYSSGHILFHLHAKRMEKLSLAKCDNIDHFCLMRVCWRILRGRSLSYVAGISYECI